MTNLPDGDLRLAALTYAYEMDVRNNKIPQYDRRDQSAALERAARALERADRELRVAAVKSVVEMLRAEGVVDPELGGGARVSTYLQEFVTKILKETR